MPIAHTLLLSSDPLHIRDAKAYRSLLSSNGVTLSSAAFYELATFAKVLYRLVGRQDFISLRSAHNMGTGTTAYTFLGKACTLVNGPTWGVDELAFLNNNCWLRHSSRLIPSTPDWGICVVGYGAPGAYGSGFGGDRNSFQISISKDAPTNLRVSDDNAATASFSAIWSTTTRGFATYAITGQQSGSAFRNSSPVGVSAGAQTYNDMFIQTDTNLWGGGSTGASTPTHRVSFLLLPTPSTALIAGQNAIYDAYKATIGAGLGLP